MSVQRLVKCLAMMVIVGGLIGFGQAPLPDLVVAEVAISPTSFGAGELVSFRATVLNRGEATVETGFTVSFFADGQAAGNGRVQPPLAPGQERAVTVLWVATGTPRAVQVEVDSRHEIDERDESNNRLERLLGQTRGSGEWVRLYEEDFEGGHAQGWQLEEGHWEVVTEADGNRVLRGREHGWASYTEEGWADFAFRLRVKLIRGSIHLNYRVGGCTRYFIGFRENGLYLNKTVACDRHVDLVQRAGHHRRGQWHAVEIRGRGGQIEISVNGQRVIQYADPDPLVYGAIALETLEESEVHVDDLEVWGAPSPTADLAWTRTGGPLGGLGYDVRMHPAQPDRMYVTDAWAGVFLSEDGGRSWFPSNEGITTRVGPSGDAIPVFSLTIDPHDPEIIWIGTQDVRGVFKSTDGGRTWREMDQGVQERFGITFRGFTVDPRSSAIVYAAAELSSHAWAGEQRQGREFDLTKGVVYKTIDGGAHWEAVWRGDNLARYVWINPHDPDVVYVSTGIFDREAANSDPQAGRPGGVGIVKSTDGGRTWREINDGLRNLYVGTLFMHPEDPEVLLAGTGNNQYHADNGVYLTTTGGDSWVQTLRGENITSVEFAASDPDVAYAGSVDAVHRSSDGGRTWTRMSGGRGGWGPPGVRAGFPIDFQADPRDPDRLFVNNYGGGNFVSADGGRTWAIASDGYTGAQVRDIAVSENGRVMAAARSGIYASEDRGETWTGFSYPPAASMEWYVVAFDPRDPEHVLAANNWERALLDSEDGGRHWIPRASPPRGNASWRAIAFAPSDPEIVYAGASAFFSAGTFDDEMPANGVYVSSDGGRSWRACNDGVSLDANVIDLAVSPSDPSIVYAATGNHGVLKSDDGGDQWQPLSRGLPDAPALTVEIDPTDPEVLFAGFRHSGLYRSDDGGASWRAAGAGMNPEASVTDLIFDPDNAAIVYAADQHSGVFRSEDGGQTWVAMNSELRTRAINALALSPDGRLLYAATEGEGVYRVDLSSEEGGP